MKRMDLILERIIVALILAIVAFMFGLTLKGEQSKQTALADIYVSPHFGFRIDSGHVEKDEILACRIVPFFTTFNEHTDRFIKFECHDSNEPKNENKKVTLTFNNVEFVENDNVVMRVIEEK